jgi:hypothetical protein
MKTNEVYSAQLEVFNSDGGSLKDCVPYFSGDLKDKPFVVLLPKTFDLEPGRAQQVLVSFQEPLTGYYQDSLNVRCLRYVDGAFVGSGDILSESQAYNVLVKVAGEGQAYIINPTNRYFFYSNPPSKETANFQIANTGTVDLDVVFELSPEYPNVKFDPIRSTLKTGEVRTYTVIVETSQDFKAMKAEFPVLIGDYADSFHIEGEKESFTTGSGAAITSIAFGSTEVNGVNIPSWLIILMLAGSSFLIYKEGRK